MARRILLLSATVLVAIACGVPGSAEGPGPGAGVKSLAVTPAILRIDKGMGRTAEMCVSNYNFPASRLPKTPDEKLMYPIVDLMPWDACSPSPKNINGIIGIVNGDVTKCTTEQKVATMVQCGARGVMLQSAAGVLPAMDSRARSPIPVLAVGPKQYEQIRAQLPIKRAVAYLPGKSLAEPSLLLVLAAAIFAFAVGGMLGGEKTLAEIRQRQQQQDPVTQFHLNSSSDGVSSSTAPLSSRSCDAPGSRQTLARQSAGGGIPALSVPMIFQMVVLMSFMLMAMYMFSDYFYVLDLYMYYILMPDVLVEFFDPYLREIFPNSRARTPLLWLVVLAVVAVWVQNRYEPGAWIFQNFVALILSIMFLREIRFPSMETVAWALGLLFVYDVFFVFVTPLFTKDGISVMEKVALSGSRPRATGGAVVTDPRAAAMRPPTWPILLVVPSYYNPLKICGIPGFNALGLGDIFWPGLVSSYSYAFDVASGARDHPYFKLAIVSYAAGLFLAMVASMVMEMGQPALLYIVPAVLIPAFYMAKSRNEEDSFWSGSLLVGS